MARKRRRRAPVALGLALAAGLGVWAWQQQQSADHNAVLPHGVVSAASGDRLIIEPDAGIDPIDQLLSSARRSLDLTMYELQDPTAEGILAGDAARGVRVRVILDRRLEGSRNQVAMSFLKRRGVAVVWASYRFFDCHEKSAVIDGKTALVMSLNLTSRYYATTRDVAVVDHDPVDVRAMEAVFNADFTGRRIDAPTGDDLVWSPDRSEADMISLIDSARHSLLVESEELSDEPVISALCHAAQRGVAVQIVMTDQASWHAGFDRIVDCGGRVSVLEGESPLYIHAKILVVDAGTADGRALVGSQNISQASLTDDRELGLVLTAPRLVNELGRLVESDAAAGREWR